MYIYILVLAWICAKTHHHFQLASLAWTMALRQRRGLFDNSLKNKSLNTFINNRFD